MADTRFQVGDRIAFRVHGDTLPADHPWRRRNYAEHQECACWDGYATVTAIGAGWVKAQTDEGGAIGFSQCCGTIGRAPETSKPPQGQHPSDGNSSTTETKGGPPMREQR